ncbi:Subtilisin-like protease SBT5.4 [Bienertia sinuspersici]
MVTFPKNSKVNVTMKMIRHSNATAGGNIVPNAESTSIQLLGFKNATVKGGAPRARVSAYKVLWPEKNEEAMELNLGKGSAMDMLAGFDAAISDGVDIINLSIEGPISQNYFEDVMSIGSFHAMMNGFLLLLVRQIVDQALVVLKTLPLGCSLSYCMPESLDPVKVKGKILICLVANAGSIDERLSKSEIADKFEAPDVIAPGSSIMAAFSEAPNATMFPGNLEHNLGRSMAAPHVAAIAALLRKVHPDWSVSAIKSAIMTTARPRDKTEKPLVDDDMVHESTPFSFGAGLVQPNLAMDPGLVYDMNQYDYLNFLCAQHYNATTIKIFSEKHDYKCPESFSLNDFNYPSIVVTEFSESVTVTRKLKNVGQPGTYTAR